MSKTYYDDHLTEVCPFCKSDYLEWHDMYNATCLMCGTEFNVKTGEIIGQSSVIP